jgi:RNA polymerase sigma factor (sigma-70 family)
MDADRVAQRRALEQCLGELSVPIRTQLLMRCFLGLSYAEIGEAIGVPHSTVQVRMSRILPQLRHCLQEEGLVR